MENKEVIVLGSARCGTSLTSAILKMLGVDMDSRVNANKYNPKGDFESLESHKINNFIFERAGGKNRGRHHHWHPPSYEAMEGLVGIADDKIEKFVSDKKGMWGWKNPKTTLAIKHYLPHLKNPYFVCVYRNLRDASNSAVKMAGGYMGFAEFLEVHSIYYNYLGKFLKEYRDKYHFYNLSYEDLVMGDKVEEQINGLANFLGVTDFNMEEIKEFIIRK